MRYYRFTLLAICQFFWLQVLADESSKSPARGHAERDLSQIMLDEVVVESYFGYRLLPPADPVDYSLITGYLRQNGLKCTVSFSASEGNGFGADDFDQGNQMATWSVGRDVVLGTTSIGIGTATYFGTLAAVGVWGTASTGVAISSLSGVAAANASLAWLGGGAVAAGGGGGMAAGAAALATGVGAVAVAAAAGGAYLWHLSDQHNETLRIAYKLEQFQDATVLDSILSRDTSHGSKDH